MLYAHVLFWMHLFQNCRFSWKTFHHNSFWHVGFKNLPLAIKSIRKWHFCKTLFGWQCTFDNITDKSFLKLHFTLGVNWLFGWKYSKMGNFCSKQFYKFCIGLLTCSNKLIQFNMSQRLKYWFPNYRLKSFPEWHVKQEYPTHLMMSSHLSVSG